jgi:hypothetical protein
MNKNKFLKLDNRAMNVTSEEAQLLPWQDGKFHMEKVLHQPHTQYW